ncbi:hypothetical protein ACJRO7_004735 [Eucalyptus globulus]|uniref:Uncharacterized protein n=1 Tax=Eucalyptus globulus TaxID=34317 RepID=A0ABD3IY10_EUCGL
MGTLVGHVAPGLGFLLIGLWHLFNHIKLHVLHPSSYKSPPWFPTFGLRYLELLSIMAGCSMSLAMELFIGPQGHQPFDSDGTIPSNHLHNFEHAEISLTFFVYAGFAILLDRVRTVPDAKHGLTQLLAAMAFGQQLLLFHFHSADHMGVEGQYHLLLQIVIFVSLLTTLMGIGLPNSFLVSFVRSTSIFFQGAWLIAMGFMLWTPKLMPKGCFMNSEEGHRVVRCQTEALHRAKSLVNIEFSGFLILISIFVVSLYLVMVKTYAGGNVNYQSLIEADELDEDSDDVELQRRSGLVDEQKGFLRGVKSYVPINGGR